jgi:hypothetical protein
VLPVLCPRCDHLRQGRLGQLASGRPPPARRPRPTRNDRVYAPTVPSLASWLTFLHVVVAFAFVAGLIGRNFTHRHAVRSSNLSTVSNLMDLAGRFEQWLIVPGSFVLLFGGLLTMWAEHLPFFEHGGYWLVTSLVVFVGLFAVLVPFVFIPRGRIFGAAMEDARKRGVVTPELSAALRDKAVAAARAAELLAVGFVLSMMVLKPF